MRLRLSAARRLQSVFFSHFLNHSQPHSHGALDVIPIPVPLPKFIPIPSQCHSRVINERHLSLNNESVQNQTLNCLSVKISTGQ